MAFDPFPYGTCAVFIALIFYLRLTRRAFSELTDEEKLRLVNARESKGEWSLIAAVAFVLFWIFVPRFFLRDYMEWVLLGECVLLVLTMFIFQAVAYRRLVKLDISETYRRAVFKGSWILMVGVLIQAATMVLGMRYLSP